MATKDFDATAEQLQAAYRAEVKRLAEERRPRILAGEFSGSTRPPNDRPRWCALADDLEEHPWVQTDRGARLVLFVSRWAAYGKNQIELPLPDARAVHAIAAVCLARDVLGFAIEQGWLRPGNRFNVEPRPARAA